MERRGHSGLHSNKIPQEPRMTDSIRFEDKVVIVTGAGGGLGRAHALLFARHGAKVLVNDLGGSAQGEGASSSAADLVVEQIRQAGGTAVANHDSVTEGEKIVQHALEAFGRVDVVVNNAGIQKHAAFLDAHEEDFDDVLGVNLRGPFFLSQAFARHLRDSGRGGRIINNSSVHEELPFPNFSDYCASKGGLKMLMRNLAIELAPLGITVNNVAPGAIETPINRSLMNQPDKLANLLGNIPAGRLGQPRDVAGAVAFLASDDAGYVTGTTLVVDGGLLWNYSEQ